MAVTVPGNSASVMALSNVMVIFGGSGDLTRRKLFPALHHLWKEKSGPEWFSVVGVGRDTLTGVACRDMLETAAGAHYGEGFEASAGVELPCRFCQKASP
jgi:glucose-6-phosphate 1-dehydrogenase